MQKDLPNLHSPSDFSLPLSTGQVRVRALTPGWIAELQALAQDTRVDDERLVREALKRASAETPADAERISRDSTGEDLERVAEKLVANHPWLIGGGPGGSTMVRRFDHETQAAHFRRALMWHRANQARAATAPVEVPVPAEAEIAADAPGAALPLDKRTVTYAFWGLVASVALSAAALGLAAKSYYDTRSRSVQLERDQRNAFDALQQQLNANNEELRRLRQDLVPPKPLALEARKAPPAEPKKASKGTRKPRREK